MKEEVGTIFETNEYGQANYSIWALPPHDIVLLIHAGFLEEVNGEWQPEEGDEYWFINYYGVNGSIWDNSNIDKDRVEFFGIYPTEEEAQSMCDHLVECRKKKQEEMK